MKSRYYTSHTAYYNLCTYLNKAAVLSADRAQFLPTLKPKQQFVLGAECEKQLAQKWASSFPPETEIQRSTHVVRVGRPFFAGFRPNVTGSGLTTKVFTETLYITHTRSPGLKITTTEPRVACNYWQAEYEPAVVTPTCACVTTITSRSFHPLLSTSKQ